jgi:iron complex transport system ATP-binding protein
VTRTAAPDLAAFDGVSFAYPLPAGGTRPVLRDLSLALRPGEMVAMVGPNGSGKTTILRLLAGMLRPDAGTVRIDGRDVADWRRDALARRVAVLPQQLDLPAGFRVVELVAMGRTPHASRLFGSTADDERAIHRALVDADACDLADRYPHELSGGERQRVLVAMALAQEPELLLLDEPTVHLDLAHQVSLLQRLRRLHSQRSLTVLAVLHDLNLAASFAPRVVLLLDGRVAADGEPGDVLTPETIERVFGVRMEPVITAQGKRNLVLDIS